MIRHGKKYPAAKVLSSINDDLEPNVLSKIKEVYNNDDNLNSLQKNQKMIIKALKKWKNLLKKGTHKDLNYHGKMCMTKLGKRLNDKLKPLVNQLNKDNIEVHLAELL